MTSIAALLSDNSGNVSEQFAVVYAPQRQRQRNRFPDNCVQLMSDAQAALAAADPLQHRYAARVFGPSRSSEGILLYYLIRWLHEA
jgi:hypothetical protein